MKREDLFEAIGQVDDSLLEENVSPPRRQPVWQLVGGFAACAAVAFLLYRMLPEKLPINHMEVEESAPGYFSPGAAVQATEDPRLRSADTEAAGMADISTADKEHVENGSALEEVHDDDGIYGEAESVTEVIGPLHPGIWYASDTKGREQFYCFHEDGKSGELRYTEYGGAVGFEMKPVGEEVLKNGEFSMLFYLGVPDPETAVVCPGEAEGTVQLHWLRTGLWESLVYLQDGDFTDFRFMLNDEICRMVEEQSGHPAICTSTGQYDQVQVYTPDDPACGYLVNRCTGRIEVFSLNNAEENPVEENPVEENLVEDAGEVAGD